MSHTYGCTHTGPTPVWVYVTIPHHNSVVVIRKEMMVRTIQFVVKET